MTNQEHRVDKEVLENELNKYFNEVNVGEEAPYTVVIDGESYIIQSDGNIAKNDSSDEEDGEDNKEEILKEIKELISIPSVLVDTPECKEAPFGIDNVRALEYILKLGEKYGFKTVVFKDR